MNSILRTCPIIPITRLEFFKSRLQLTVELNGSTFESVALCNGLGQNVASCSFEDGKAIVDTEFLPSGVYFLKLTSSEQGVRTLKVIKQ